MNTDSFIFIDFEYAIKGSKCKVLNTNIKKEMIDNFLEEWVVDQVGAGEDKNEAVDRETYRINIGCDLSTDTFYIKSNTGNKGLTAGIVSRVWANKLWEIQMEKVLL